MSIGDRFKYLRMDRSQAEFATLIGSTKQNISKYEMNSMMPGGEVLLRMAQVLNVNINWLLTGEGSAYIEAGLLAQTKKRKKDLNKVL
jgi:transcriptional regulator with XRE-family HTH domain